MGRSGRGRRSAIVAAAVLGAWAAACVPYPSRRPRPPVDAAAQRGDYDRGLRYFGQEKYLEAREAWRKTVADGPGTPLGRKAAEHLRKLGQMLGTLKEIERDAQR